MSKNEHDSSGVRVQILKDLFSRVAADKATVLVGVLFEYRFVLSVESWNPASQTVKHRTIELPPLDPQAASILVADVFGFDCDQLFDHFQQDWASLKHSVVAKELKVAIQSHDSVDHLEECPPLL